jgi:diacylglycerol kinase (ATP)
MRATLLHNPKAGRSDHDADDLTSLLREHGFDVTYASTKTPEYPDALHAPADLLVIAGGDGTVRKIMTRIEHRETPILILPLGTANNVARSLGLSREPQELLASVAGDLAGARRMPFDIGIAEGPWGASRFVEAVGCGALAAIMDEPSKAVGQKRLDEGRDALCEVVDAMRPMRASIAVDEHVLEGPWLMIEILNNPFSGPKLLLAPNADPGDGLLDLVCLRESRRKDMIEWLRAPDAERARDAPPMVVARGRRMSLDVEKGWPLRLDDQECDTTGWKGDARICAWLQEQPLQVLVPEEPDGETTGGDGKELNHERAAGE